MASEDRNTHKLTFTKFIFYYFKFSGVATLVYNSELRDKNNVPRLLFTDSTRGKLYNNLLACLVIFSAYFSVKVSYFSNLFQRIKLEKVVDTIQTLVTVLTATIILIIFCIRQQQTIVIFNRIHKLSNFMHLDTKMNTRVKSTLNDIKTAFFAHAVTLLLFIITTPLSRLSIMYFAGVTLCSFIINSIIMQYTIVLKLIRHIFGAINAELLEVLSKLSDIHDINFIHVHGVQMKSNKLSLLRELYILMGKMSQDLSDFYSAPMIMCLANGFLTLIVCSYYVAKPFVVAKSDMPDVLIVHCACQILVYAVSFILLMRSATTAVIEVIS